MINDVIKIIVLVICNIIMTNPFAANFDLPEQKCSNGPFSLFFGDLLLFSAKFSTMVTKSVFCFLRVIEMRLSKKFFLQILQNNCKNHY
jgi:hypothetical protein